MMNKNNKRLHRKRRIRVNVLGTVDCPRLSVFRSLRNIYAQLIVDEKGVTIASASALSLGVKPNLAGAQQVGKVMAGKCKELKIDKIVFDRSGYRYHGRVKALAEEMRKEGLKF
nr:ribosomal protein L18 [uncultured bacterium]